MLRLMKKIKKNILGQCLEDCQTLNQSIDHVIKEKFPADSGHLSTTGRVFLLLRDITLSLKQGANSMINLSCELKAIDCSECSRDPRN